MKFIGIVTLYNTLLDENVYIQNFLGISELIELYIMDNSDNEYIRSNKKYKNKKLKYYTFGENLGISKAYNFLFDQIEKVNQNIIVILDQDTEISSDYFFDLKQKMENEQCNIYMPIVLCKKFIMSPCRRINDFWIRPYNKIIDYVEDNISCINSGMAVRSSVTDHIKYNEDLFLDYTDHDFVYRYLNKFGKDSISIGDVVINQNFSEVEISQTDFNAAMFRFSIFIKDFKSYYRSNFGFIYIPILILIVKSLRLSIHYKTFLFIKRVFH